MGYCGIFAWFMLAPRDNIPQYSTIFHNIPPIIWLANQAPGNLKLNTLFPIFHGIYYYLQNHWFLYMEPLRLIRYNYLHFRIPKWWKENIHKSASLMRKKNTKVLLHLPRAGVKPPPIPRPLCPHYQGPHIALLDDQISWSYVKRFSRESAHTHTDTQTGPLL